MFRLHTGNSKNHILKEPVGTKDSPCQQPGVRHGFDFVGPAFASYYNANLYQSNRKEGKRILWPAKKFAATWLRLPRRAIQGGQGYRRLCPEHFGMDESSCSSLEAEFGQKFHSACENKQIELALELVKECPDLVWFRDPITGESPLHWSASTGNQDLVKCVFFI